MCMANETRRMIHQASTNVTWLVPPGQIRCYVTGNLRKDTPEEHIRQRWARSLVEEYGYAMDDLGIEVPIAMGRARKRVDLVVYRQLAPHEQKNIYIIVEAKRDDIKSTDAKLGRGQLESYMAACPACRYGLWVGEERRGYEKPTDGGLQCISDIPHFGYDQPKLPTRETLVRAHELKSVFRRCHNYIFANAGMQKDKAFHELLKLIFCKTFDEEEGGEILQFAIGPYEQRATSGQRRLMEERLAPLFERVKQRYPFIFGPEEKIDLDIRVASYVVAELQYLSLLDTATDVKGDAYEELVGANLRGDRGQYFTPRNVCDMVVKMSMSLYRNKDLTSLKILDCCCGTGGFLVSWLSNLYSQLLEQEQSRPQRVGSESPHVKARGRARKVCEQNLFGLDIDPTLVSTCQMNLVMHGDGSTNVFRVDSVRSPGEWDSDARRRIPYGEVDIVLTNPPFGGRAKVNDGHILDHYELARWEKEQTRRSMPAEQLFIEAALRFVKPGGYLVIVLPDSILNNPGLLFIRSWLICRTKVIASVDLPKTTFAASGGVNNPSVLVLQRLSESEARRVSQGIMEDRYDVFMARPKTSGIDKRANPIFKRHPDGQENTNERGEKVRDDEVSEVPELFRSWLSGVGVR